MADKTRTWHADSTAPYALAALALFDFARTRRNADFAFGPLNVAAMTDGGLWVAGEPSDVEAAAVVLKDVPGLTEYVSPDYQAMSDWVTRDDGWVTRDRSAGVGTDGDAEHQDPVADLSSGDGSGLGTVVGTGAEGEGPGHDAPHVEPADEPTE